MRKIIIEPNETGQRLDKFLFRYLNKPPKSLIHKLLRKKSITVNGARAEGSYMLAFNDEVEIFVSQETLKQYEAPPKIYPKGHVDIIFEDEDIILVNKPADLLTQPNEPNADSLIGRLINIYHNAGSKSFAPVAINRLDRNTTGIVICAKNLPAAQRLSKLIHDGLITKTYLAAAHGKVGEISEEIVLNDFISKDKEKNISSVGTNGKSAVTKLFPLFYDSDKDITVLKIILETGRSHQIRAHLKSIGNPLVGDVKYGGHGAKRQLLHAFEVSIPLYEGKTFKAGLPEDMQWIKL